MTPADLIRRTEATSSGCMEWTGARSPGKYPYGRVAFRGKNGRTHRVIWELANGPIPPAMDVCHRCDNPPCINVEHLFIGTRSENALDAVAKGRLHGGNGLFGEQHPLAKLTEEAVLEARRLHARGHSFRSLAFRYGVCRAAITDAIRGDHWAHLGPVL